MADVPYRHTGSTDQPPSALDRIDHAITRIETAAAARTASSVALAERHATLRTRMSEAIGALDAVLTPPEGEG